MVEPIIILLGVGAVGGMVRSVLGYSQQANPGEAFDWAKFGRSTLRAAILGASVVMGISIGTGTAITTATFITAFFLSVGVDVMTKETYGTVAGKVST